MVTVFYPGHDRSPVPVGTDDVQWIPVASAGGWVVVARDKKIRHRPAEWASLAENPLRILVLTTVGNLSVWEQLCVLVARWERIEELSGRASLDARRDEEWSS